MRRVIYFPPDWPKPEFRWLALKGLIDDDDRPEAAQTVEYKTLIGKDTFTHTRTFNRNNIVGTALELTIDVCYDDGFPRNFSENNNAVIGTRNKKVGHSWRGPMVAYCGHTRKGSWFLRLLKSRIWT